MTILNIELHISTFSDVPNIPKPDLKVSTAFTAISLLLPSGAHHADPVIIL